MSDALFDLEPLIYPSLTEAANCRDCRRPIVGRWSRLRQGISEMGYWAQCDDCNPLGKLPDPPSRIGLPGKTE